MKNDNEYEVEVLNSEGDIVENENVLTFSSTYKFEGNEYNTIDLSGLFNLTAMDMLSIDRELLRGGSTSVLQEMSLEYVIKLASKATKLPIEFFEQLPPPDVIKLKMKVIAFLFGMG